MPKLSFYAKAFFLCLAFSLALHPGFCLNERAFFAYECDATDISNFISSEMNVLESGETVGNIIGITKDKELYCVSQIVSKGKTTGYVAVSGGESQIVTDETLNKRLFQTTEFIAQYQQFKKSISDKAMPWFIAKWNYIGTISVKISSETLDLDLIRSMLKSSKSQSIVSEMDSKLSQISTALNVLKNKMSATENLESTFITKPALGGEKALKEAIVECYAYLSQLHQLNLEYAELQKKLRIEIADEPELSIEAKQQLNKAAELPEEFGSIEQWYQSTENMALQKTMETISINASSASAEFAKRVAVMLKRDTVFKSLYAVDTDLKKKTDGNFASLKEAFEKMTSEQAKDLWKDQQRLKQFSDEWTAAEEKFKARDYDKALEWAKKAKASAIAVYSAGLEPLPSDGINYELLISAAVIIIFIIIILYIVKNRKKLLSFVSGSEEEEKVVFDGI
ncbi:MAG: hypothetical protein QXK06_04275 [Candidatus Diapherotrites archaeon]